MCRLQTYSTVFELKMLFHGCEISLSELEQELRRHGLEMEEGGMSLRRCCSTCLTKGMLRQTNGSLLTQCGYAGWKGFGSGW